MKSFLAEELCADAAALLKARATGFAISTFLTDRVDTIMREEFRAVMDTLKHDEGNVSLVAVGGYGRREMMPYSDIDIMLLVRADSVPAKEIAQAVLYRLWDKGMHISHAYRTLKACVDDSMKDLQTRTSLIEARFLAGSEALFEEYRRDIHQKLLFKDKRAFVSSVMREVERRHREAGASLYVLEPNVKEGQGGLRDVHTLTWLARSELRLSSFDDYQQLWSRRRHGDFIKAYSFMLRVRAGLHVLSSRRNDTVSAEYQDDLADLLGFRKTKRFYASEIMMRIYYRKAKAVNEALFSVMRHCGSRYFSLPLSFGVRRITESYAVSRNEIICRDDKVLKTTSGLMEAFSVFSSTGKPLSAHLEDRIRSGALMLRQRMSLPAKSIELFREILRGNRVYETLYSMHETGVLGRFIPEFGRIRHLVILEAFHRYTVDEHTLRAIKFLEELRTSKERRLQFLAELLGRTQRDILYLALLLHDIGKGVARSHEEAGYIMIKGVLERLCPDQADRLRIEFLVRNHIILAKLALTRDIESPETMPQLAEIVEREELLDALYLMTYADMAAVSEGFWNDWKASMLHSLYLKTRDHLRGIRRDARATVPVTLRGFVERMPDRYIMASTKDDMTLDDTLYRRAMTEDLSMSINERQDGTAECTIVTVGKPRLFARIAGIFSAGGFNIVRARLFTGSEGLVIRRILLSNWKSLYWNGLEEQLREKMTALVTTSSSEIQDGCASEPHALPPRRFECFLELDNETAEQHSILEVMMPDRKGLLYDIARCLYSLEVDILSAIINTEHAMAQDVFYIQKSGSGLDASSSQSVLKGLYAMSPWAARKDKDDSVPVI